MARKVIPNSKKINAGSTDSSGEPSFLIIGRIQKPHGVRGEVRVVAHTGYPERFTWLETVYVGETDPQPVAVEGARFHGELVLLKLAGYDSREAVQGLRGQWLQVPESEAVPLEEGEYYLYQLEGLQVFTDVGEDLGELVQVMETGANNVFIVRGESGELLLPDTDEVVQEIDFENGRMTVHLLAGLRP
ncbi:MAG: ribosome maturation factor RimM [Anaerolineae bacterium]